MARRGISSQQLKEMLKKPFYNNNPRGQASKARIKDELSRGSTPIQKSDQLRPLDRQKESQSGMVNIHGPVHCRIIRNIPRRGQWYDDDNYSGGLKECRDAAAAMLGLKGDSPKDGITFEYIQNETKEAIGSMEIEIYSVEADHESN